MSSHTLGDLARCRDTNLAVAGLFTSTARPELLINPRPPRHLARKHPISYHCTPSSDRAIRLAGCLIPPLLIFCFIKLNRQALKRFVFLIWQDLVPSEGRTGRIDWQILGFDGWMSDRSGRQSWSVRRV